MHKMRVEMSESSWQSFSIQFPELFPEIKIGLISCDHNLMNLGFTDDAPCVVEISVTADKFEELMDDLMQLEVDAYNTEDGDYPAESDPYYQKYLKYGWMYDLLYAAYEKMP